MPAKMPEYLKTAIADLKNPKEVYFIFFFLFKRF